MSPRRILAAVLSLSALVPLLAAAVARQDPFAPGPGPEHALLQKLAGTWTASFEMTMPGAPPMKSRGTEVNELLGRLWIVSRYDDPGMMGSAFAGAQLIGYDPDEKKYVAAWADSQSPSLSLQRGTFDEATRTLTLVGASKDPMTGADSTVRSVMTCGRRPPLADDVRARPRRKGARDVHDRLRAREVARRARHAARPCNCDPEPRRETTVTGYRLARAPVCCRAALGRRAAAGRRRSRGSRRC